MRESCLFLPFFVLIKQFLLILKKSDCFNRGPTSKKDGEVFQYYPFYWLYGIVMLTVAAINFLIGKELKKHLTNVRKGKKRLFKATLGPSLEILQQMLKHSSESLGVYIKKIENFGLDEFELAESPQEKLKLLKTLQNYLNTLIHSLSKSIKNRDISFSVKDKHFNNVINEFDIKNFDIKAITETNVDDGQRFINKLTKNFKKFFDLVSDGLAEKILKDLSTKQKEDFNVLKESRLATAANIEYKIKQLADAERLTQDFKLFVPSTKPYSVTCLTIKIAIMFAIITLMMVYRIFPCKFTKNSLAYRFF